MESSIKLQASLEEMEKLFDDTQGGFLIKYYERIEKNPAFDTFKVIVRHGDNIGYKDGETYDYQSFIDTFDDLELRARIIGDNYFAENDMKMAQKGLEGGFSAKTVSKILKIYGSSKCSDAKYVKALMKSEKIQGIVNQMKNDEKELGSAR